MYKEKYGESSTGAEKERRKGANRKFKLYTQVADKLFFINLLDTFQEYASESPLAVCKTVFRSSVQYFYG